jgi:hypothetical protein
MGGIPRQPQREIVPRDERAASDRIRHGHPLAPALPLLRQTLVDIADHAMHLMIVTDERGLVLGQAGPRVEGAEESATDEHLTRTYHSWTCAAAPIREPVTGRLIGAVDVTGPARTFHPTTLKLVIAAARLAECHLATQVAVRDERLLARGFARLTALRGEPGALLAPDGRVLAAQPEGWVPPRIVLPKGGRRVWFRGGEGVLEPLAEGWLLRRR